MMNERIKELAKLAGLQTEQWHKDAQGDGYKTPNYELEKFAQLLVNACAQQATLFSLNKHDIHPDIKWDDMNETAKMVNHATCQQVAAKIREHFGVE